MKIKNNEYMKEAIPVNPKVLRHGAGSGQAFSASAFNLYNYNDRSELTESSRYSGSDTGDTSNPVEPEYRSYDYDPIGNRKDTADWDKAEAVQNNLTYTSNQLNQYELIINDIGQPADSLT